MVQPPLPPPLGAVCDPKNAEKCGVGSRGRSLALLLICGRSSSCVPENFSQVLGTLWPIVGDFVPEICPLFGGKVGVRGVFCQRKHGIATSSFVGVGVVGKNKDLKAPPVTSPSGFVKAKGLEAPPCGGFTRDAPKDVEDDGESKPPVASPCGFAKANGLEAPPCDGFTRDAPKDVDDDGVPKSAPPVGSPCGFVKTKDVEAPPVRSPCGFVKANDVEAPPCGGFTHDASKDVDDDGLNPHHSPPMVTDVGMDVCAKSVDLTDVTDTHGR